MKTTDTEKEWLRRINNGMPQHKAETAYAMEKVMDAVQPTSGKGKGFEDIAGMEDLKLFVSENFINVLRNKERAGTIRGRRASAGNITYDSALGSQSVVCPPMYGGGSRQE